MAPPQSAIVGGKPSSPTPAGSAAAMSQLRSSQPEPLPSVQRHHLTPHDLAEPPRPSASTESHRSSNPQKSRSHRLPRSSPPMTHSVPTGKSTTGRTALISRIHPCPWITEGRLRSPASLAGAPPLFGRKRRRARGLVKPDQWTPRTHCQ